MMKNISIRMLRPPDVIAVRRLSRVAIYAKNSPEDKAQFDADFS
ncbi:hypothetical protein [Neisseria animaloris]|nr:hypothetical protein [Neisseria animaloris]